MSDDDDDLTPAQQEFQREVTALLGKYTRAVGPEFDGTDEGFEVEMPVPVAWILVADWDDIARAGNGSTVVMHSGCRRTQRLGMLDIAHSCTVE